jgi:glycerol-3-phosphate dehydrogenase
LAAIAAERCDVLVIGGGITGAGVALDAASRGYSVALVEQADYASGTSSRSSKLVHGGLRYLQSFDLGLVRDALLERRLMVRLAPHLVRPLPMIVPAGRRCRRCCPRSPAGSRLVATCSTTVRPTTRGWC